MDFFIQRSELRDIYDKVAAGERISDADALRLFESKDLNAVGAIADFARQKRLGHNRASYIINRYINYSNYCILSCQFCSFARKKRDADGFQFSVEEIVQKAREALALGITELHIVGGLHPSLPFGYYTDMLKALRALNQVAQPSRLRVRAASRCQTTEKRHDPRPGTAREPAGGDARATPELHLKCFTAIEILHLAWLAKKSVEQTLIELKAAGLDSLTGGGAEIFRKEVRSHHRPRQGIRRGISGRPPHLAPARRAQHLHDALRPRRKPRRPRGPSAAIARVAGRDARLHAASCRWRISRRTTTFP